MNTYDELNKMLQDIAESTSKLLVIINDLDSTSDQVFDAQMALNDNQFARQNLLNEMESVLDN